VTVEERLLPKAVKLANIVLGGGGLAFTLILFYFLYFYYSGGSGEGPFASPVGILLHYVCPLSLAGLCFASLRLQPFHRINVACLLFSAGASIYVLESVMSIWFSLPSVIQEGQLKERVEAAKELGIEFDTRSKLEVVNDLRKKGIDAYPIVSPAELLGGQADGRLKSKITINGKEVLPLSGISHKVSVLCNESGEYITYESDERGFHNPTGFWNDGQIDIVALGDSYVQGVCVPADKNFVALIRKSYPASLNLGVSGSGPLLTLAVLKEYAALVKPKVVVWFYFEGNDLDDLTHREKDSPLLMRYMESDFWQGLFNQQVNVDQALMAYVETVRNTHKPLRRLKEISAIAKSYAKRPRKMKEILSLNHVRQRLGLVYGKKHEYYGESPDRDESANFKADIDLFRKILLQAIESVGEWRGTLYFVYLPDWHRYAKPQIAKGNRNRVLQLAKTLGLHVIDIHHAFEAEKDPLALFPFRLNSHYNETGHRLVAEEVLRVVSLGN
jgi:lysophospholipase L1-like esterase